MPIYGIMITKRVVNTRFRNTYRVFAESLGQAANGVTPLLDFEASLFFDTVEILKSNVWLLNSVDPNDFHVIPHPGVAGDRPFPVGHTLAPLPVVANFSLAAASGFPGKKAYRGTYLSAEVSGNQGEIDEVGNPGINAIWQSASTDLLEGLDGIGLALHIGGNESGTGSRVVSQFALQGPGVMKMNKRWYNLVPGGGGD